MQTERLSPGFDPEDIGTNPTSNRTFDDVLERRLSRRQMLKGAAASVPLFFLGTSTLACDDEAEPNNEAATKPATITFAPIAPNTDDKVSVPAGYEVQVLLRWGDPVLEGSEELRTHSEGLRGQTATVQAKQFGYNCDFIGYFPRDWKSKDSTSGYLAVNHEYTTEALMFPGYDPTRTTKQQVDVALAAHGMSIVEIAKNPDGRWAVRIGPKNRRITGETEIALTGPAAGNDKLKTSGDPAGTKVLGTLNNCAGGKTPWGTVLTAEENFNQYFGNLNSMPDSDTRKAMLKRYGVTPGASERLWEKFYPRFDVAKEPNESFRFGWLVEIDPYDATSTPKKRTALGRMKHEGAAIVLAADKRAVVYTGDDERFEYIYKFVSADKVRSKRESNGTLLDKGTLYVAKLNDDGSGDWLPLVHGQGPLTAENGFSNQGEVLINARLAGDALGATKMDRPEDIEVSPATGKVYAIMTNNTNRTTEQINRANPRANNRFGHIIEISENNGDHASLSFHWDMFLQAGDPTNPAHETYFRGQDKSKVTAIATPDNAVFGAGSNLWIATNGQPETLGTNDALFAVPTAGEELGYIRRFLTGPVNAEITGPEFTPDFTTLFVSIQHPGEGSGSTVENPRSRWPDNSSPPRPSVVAIVKTDAGVIGT